MNDDDLLRRSVELDRAVRAHLARLTYPMFAQPPVVAEARRRLTRHLLMSGFERYRESAVLCLTELLTNAIVHVGLDVPVALRVSAPCGELRIGVTDPDARSVPLIPCASAEAETGRGLVLLTAFSSRWGVDQHEDGKTVWCEPLPDCPAEEASPGKPRPVGGAGVPDGWDDIGKVPDPVSGGPHTDRSDSADSRSHLDGRNRRSGQSGPG